MEVSQAKPSDRFIPYYIVAFFVLLTCILGTFIWIAVHNYSGEVTTNPYTKGLQYNKDIANQAAQEKLGWQGNIRFETHGFDVQSFLTLTDSKGKPVTGAVAEAWFIRTTQAGHDTKITLVSNGKGNYVGKTKLFWKGVWEVHISATYNGHNYQQVRDVYLR